MQEMQRNPDVEAGEQGENLTDLYHRLRTWTYDNPGDL